MAKKVLSVNEQKIIDNVSIVDYYNTHIVPNRQGFRKIADAKPSGLCPFHDDTDPSFHYWKEKKLFHCFGCKKTGNVITMHILWQGQEFKRFINTETAVKELAQMYGIPLEIQEDGKLVETSPFEKARKVFDTKQYEVNTFDMKNLTVAGFRTFHNQIRTQISRNPYLIGEQAARLYDKLDLTLSTYLANKK